MRIKSITLVILSTLFLLNCTSKNDDHSPQISFKCLNDIDGNLVSNPGCSFENDGTEVLYAAFKIRPDLAKASNKIVITATKPVFKIAATPALTDKVEIDGSISEELTYINEKNESISERLILVPLFPDGLGTDVDLQISFAGNSISDRILINPPQVDYFTWHATVNTINLCKNPHLLTFKVYPRTEVNHDALLSGLKIQLSSARQDNNAELSAGTLVNSTVYTDSTGAASGTLIAGTDTGTIILTATTEDSSATGHFEVILYQDSTPCQ